MKCELSSVTYYIASELLERYSVLKDKYKTSYDNETDRLFIELNNLEDIFDIAKLCNGKCIIEYYGDENEIPVLTIYDGYIE